MRSPAALPCPGTMLGPCMYGRPLQTMDLAELHAVAHEIVKRRLCAVLAADEEKLRNVWA